MGRPMLASDVTGCNSVVQHGINGYLFEPKSVISIIDSIKKFISLTFEERNELSKNAYNIARKEFNENIVINKYIDTIFNKV